MTGVEDKHLEWLDKERKKRTFNLGDFNIRVAPDVITVQGKDPATWGRDLLLNPSRTRASITTESRTPLYIFYLVYAVYAYGFLMFFVTTGISILTQVSIFALALFLMFMPLIFELSLPTKPFLIATAAFFVVMFSLSDAQPFKIAFEAVEKSVGKGNVEAFTIFASILPILLRRMIGQMMIRYRLKLEDGPSKLEITTENPSAVALVDYLDHGPAPRRFLRLPFFFLTLSRKKMKTCFYCRKLTLDECNRCHRPICESHFEMLHGYKVCADCFIERRGKIRYNLR